MDGQNHICAVHKRYFWQRSHQIYGHIRCVYGILGREITKYTVIYGVHVRFWPTLNKCAHTYSHMHMFKQYMQTHTPDTYARICRSTHAHTHTHAHKRTHTHFAQPNITHTCTHQHPMSTCERLALVSGQASTKHFIQPDTHTHTRAHLTSPPMGTCGRLALVSGQASINTSFNLTHTHTHTYTHTHMRAPHQPPNGHMRTSSPRIRASFHRAQGQNAIIPRVRKCSGDRAVADGPHTRRVVACKCV
jgi:hypothetical protein